MEKRKQVFALDMEEYQHLSDNNGGICKECGEHAEGGVEPDAEGYECEMCGEPAVYGIEQALLLGIITIE